ncbi:MAG: DUF3566 domain-containing protein [Planctomycetota bacterium]|jgi:hypothetical protein
MQVEIRRISIRSAFKLAMVLYGLIGFLVGLVLAVAASVEVPPGTEPNILTRLGFWSIAVFPVLYGLAGGFTAAVTVALYNAGASLVGGLRLDFPEVEPESDGRVKVAGRAARYLERMRERESTSRAPELESAESAAEDTVGESGA